MTKDIKNLSPEQEAMIDGLIQEWIGHGLSCAPANRDAATEALERVYHQSKFKFPKMIYWCASPRDGCIVAATLVAGKEVGSYEPTPEEIRAQLNTCIYGQHEASWLAFYNAYQNLGITGLDEIVPFQELGKASGWVWPFDNAIVFCERPRELHFSEDHSLHSETRPAIWYPGKEELAPNTFGEGIKVYCINNTMVPPELVEDPSKITVPMIKEHENTEVRRLLRNAYGNERYLVDIGAKVIDVDTVSVDTQDQKAHAITRALMEDDEGRRWIIFSDGSTPRTYSERAPDNCETCAEAYEAITGTTDKQIIAQG